MASISQVSKEWDSVFRAIQSVLATEKAVGQKKYVPRSRLSILQASTSSNSTIMDTFCCELTTAIHTTLVSVGEVQPQLARERAFTNFHHFRILKLPAIWKTLLDRLHLPLQAVNRQLFNQLIVEAFASFKSTPDALTQKRVNLSKSKD